jgi:hypothetical protein
MELLLFAVALIAESALDVALTLAITALIRRRRRLRSEARSGMAVVSAGAVSAVTSDVRWVAQG